MLKIIINNQSDGLHMNFSPLTKYLIQTLSLLCFLSAFGLANAAVTQDKPKNVIQDVKFATLPGNRLQISLELSNQAVEPLSFTIDNPARIAFDFANNKTPTAHWYWHSAVYHCGFNQDQNPYYLESNGSCPLPGHHSG